MSKRIAPDKEGAIEASFNSGSYKGDVKKIISVYTNDSTNSVVKLALKAKVFPACPWIK